MTGMSALISASRRKWTLMLARRRGSGTALTSGVSRHWGREPQQPLDTCMGGHLTVPNEQNTQQSPRFGRNNLRQLVHS
jgi:hypothetical protein